MEFKSAPRVAQSTGKTWRITSSSHVAALAEAEVDILSGQGAWPVSHLLEEGLKEVEGGHHPNSGDPDRSPQALCRQGSHHPTTAQGQSWAGA